MEMKKYVVRLLEYGSDKYAHLRYLPAAARVLDIGCGDCRRLRYRSYYRDDLMHYGVDIHEEENCRKYLSEFVNLDVTRDKLPFAEEYFDLVMVSHVVEHLSREGFLFCLKEIKRVLRRGGYVYIEFPSEKTRRFITAKTLKRLGCPVTTLNFFDDETHISLYGLQELAGILEGEGLGICKCGDIMEPVKKLLSPLLLVIGYALRDESIFTGSLWSLVNWASFLLARKQG